MNYYPPNTENNYIAVGILRNKITGTANDKLASFNTVLNFKAIIARLDQCFGDKRSLQALENELSILRQGEKSISDFYNLVDQHLTLIINKNKMSYPNNDDIANALNERARDNALRVFISGLKRPLSDILFSARSTDLPTALATAQELESDQRRQEFARIFAMGDKARVPRSQQLTTTPPQISHPAYKTQINKTFQRMTIVCKHHKLFLRTWIRAHLCSVVPRLTPTSNIRLVTKVLRDSILKGNYKKVAPGEALPRKKYQESTTSPRTFRKPAMTTTIMKRT